ncbi:ABC transporter permease [Metabacillus fastidiosus]|uniref:ABC transporter permease n=1 Tax=Metabacillus fastidiosus TaxID=1458 RepID=UPI002E20019F
MFKLIKLEIRKNRLLNYWKGIAIANISFIAFLSMIYFVENNDGNIIFENFEMAVSIVNTVVRAIFIIFTAVIITKLVIDEYKDKSIGLMFTYPIKRKKIMASKLIIIVMFTFVNVLFSTLFISGLIYLGDGLFNIIPGEIERAELLRQILIIFLYALATAGLSLIPIFFGMLRKSAPATIVSSIFLASFTGSTGNNFNMFSIIAIPISLALIGIFIGWMSIRNIEKVDTL